ncbi:MAG: GatB/YqeY domain-containing protein [Patescibacteria group bacterium]
MEKNLKEKIASDFKESFKSKDEIRLSVLKLLQSEIKNAEIAKRTKLSKDGESDLEAKSQLNDEEILQVISREIKKRKDAVDLYEKGGRSELAEKEKKEIAILSDFLPEQLSEDQIRDLVKGAIEQSGAKNIKEIGKVMSILMPKIKGRADGALVNKIIKKLLS